MTPPSSPGADDRSRRWGRPRALLSAVATLPAAALSLLPSFTCPACLAAYAGVLSSLGLGVALDEQVLAPLIALFLVVGIWSVARTTRSHRRPGPLVTTVVASALVVVGRLVWDVPGALYVGAGLLVVATLWNLWLKSPVRLARNRAGA